ncbi:MAG: hypothetical protein AAFY41_14790, partial [Bacteroidota bacterium]
PEFTKQSNTFLARLEEFKPQSENDKRTTIKIDTIATEDLLMLGKKNAFDEQQVIEVVNELKKRNASGGYEILVDAIEINPYGIKLLEAYVFAALDWNLNEYAYQTMERLEILLHKVEYNVLFARYLQKKQELETEEW